MPLRSSAILNLDLLKDSSGFSRRNLEGEIRLASDDSLEAAAQLETRIALT